MVLFFLQFLNSVGGPQEIIVENVKNITKSLKTAVSNFF
jgi:hypothetical protein